MLASYLIDRNNQQQSNCPMMVLEQSKRSNQFDQGLPFPWRWYHTASDSDFVISQHRTIEFVFYNQHTKFYHRFDNCELKMEQRQHRHGYEQRRMIPNSQ